MSTPAAPRFCTQCGAALAADGSACAACSPPVAVAAEERKPAWKKIGGPATVAALALWKMKGLVVVLASKAKFLLFGFSKLSTLLSMFASLGLYLALFGWRFALGLVLSIYVHEMGHVAAYRRYGIPVSAPMFVPGFGAFVRGQYVAADAGQQARISLAGPLWGLGAALVCFAMAAATGSAAWAAIAGVGAQINLLNLIPIWIFDGAGAVAPLSRMERWILFGVTAVLWFATGEGVLFFVGAAMLYRAARKKQAGEGSVPAAARDWQLTIQFAGLLAALAIMAQVPVDTSR